MSHDARLGIIPCVRSPEDRLFEKYCRRRDARLLAKIFDRTAPALLRIARHTAPHRDLADDLLQQTFLVAIERADRWDPERPLFPWLIGILVNQAKLFQRREARQPAPERLSTSTLSPPAVDTSEARELEQAITAAVAELGDTYRPVLHLHLFHGLNAKEIAAALARPAGSVRTQLVRGLQRLRQALPVGLAVGATLLAPALATARQFVLQRANRHAATLSATTSAPALILFGSSMMKKWSLAVLAALLVALAVYPTLPTAGGEPVAPAPPRPDVAVAEVGALAANTPAANLQRDPTTTAIASNRDAVATLRASLQIRVVAGSNAEAQGIEGAWVYLHTNQMRKVDDPRFGAITDANGLVQFDDVPAGSWRAHASIAGGGARQSLRLEPGERREMVLTSSLARFFEVIVVDTNGRPVADAEIWSGRKSPGRIFPLQGNARRSGRTGPTGKARVAAGVGEFVGARKHGYMASRSSPTETTGTDAIVLTLRNDPGTLHGEVAYDTGKPVPGATVLVSPLNTKPNETMHRGHDGRTAAAPLAVLEHTDEYGRFSVPGLAPATYRIWTNAASRMHKGATITIAAHDKKHVRIVVQRPAYVTGSVHRRDGTPAAGIYIGARQPNDKKLSVSGVVNLDGTFTFQVPRGPVSIEIWRTFGAPILDIDAIAKAKPEAISLTIDDPMSVSGRLLSEDDLPITDWIIGAVPAGTELTECCWRSGASTRDWV